MGRDMEAGPRAGVSVTMTLGSSSSPGPSARPRWHLGRRGWVALAAVVVLAGGATAAGLMASSFAHPGPAAPSIDAPTRSSHVSAPVPVGSGWLASPQGGVAFLQWDDTGGRISGSVQVAYVDGQAPNASVSTDTLEVSGTLSRSTISLSFDGSPLQFGTVGRNSFTIDVPQQDGTFSALTFHAAPTSAYNNAVASLESQVGQDNAAALQQQQLRQAQQQVANAAQSVFSDISSLNQTASALPTDLQAISDDLASSSRDLAQAHAEANQVSSDAADYGTSGTGPTCSDAQAVAGDAQAVAGDAQAVESDAQTMAGNISQIYQQISGLQSDFGTYQEDESSLAGYTPDPAPTQSNVENTVSAARSTAADALTAANKAIAQANSEVTQAFGYVSEAYSTGGCGSPPSSPSPVPPVTASQ